MRLPLLISISFMFLFTRLSFGQERKVSIDKVIDLPTSFFQKIRSGASKAEARLQKQTEKYLRKLARQEAELQRKISRIDSAASQRLFSGSAKNYEDLLKQLKEKQEQKSPLENSYIPFLDTLKTSLRFLEQSRQIDLNKLPTANSDIKAALDQLSHLQGKFNQTEEINRLLQQRKQYLRQQLNDLGLVKDLKKFEQQVYYYQQQVKEYRNMLNDPKKLEATAVRVIQKIPIVSDFLSRHSELAGIFQLPNSSGVSNPVNVQGLQTRSSVLQQMQQTLGTGVNPQQLIQQSSPDLKGQLNQLKDKINQLGGGGQSDEDLPNFRPNSQRTRPFFKRLELGTNIQSVKGNFYFPVTSDIAITIGLRISDRNIAGLGFSYKLGLGSSWRDIQLTHQGLGIRSYWDWKMKGNFWLSAGAELNYRNQIKKIDLLKNFSAWQQSALAGISKKYKAGKKMQGKMQLLYDFLHGRQVPAAPPFVFRVGYTFSK